MEKKRMKKFMVGVGLVVLMAFPVVGAEFVTNSMAQLIEVLKSEAGQELKASACRDLGLVGGKDAVPILAGLLGDEKLAHMARYGLEQIPDPAVDEALRVALSNVKGPQLVGVINSIGARRDVKAMEQLGALLKDQDQQVAHAAAAALGRLGTVDAGKILESVLEQAKGEEMAYVCDAILCCADRLMSQRKESKALGLFEKVSNADVPVRFKAVALRGVIRCSGQVNMLVDMLNSSDQLMFSMGLMVAQELKGRKVTSALIFQLGRLHPEKVVQLVQVLGKRRDRAAAPELIALVRKKDKATRMAAVRSLSEIGDSAAAPVFMDLLKDPDPEIVQVASLGLASLSDPGVNDDVIKMLDCPDSAVRARMFDLVGQRRIKKAIPVLVKAMDDKDEVIRFAAIRNFGLLAGTSELPSMLEKIVKSTNAGEIGALEKALSSICSTGSDQGGCVQKLAESLQKATPESKSALLRVLRTVGGAAALKVVRGCVGDSNKDVHKAAVRVLSEWKTVDVIPVLQELARNSTEQLDKILSLRGCLGMVSKKEVPPKEKLSICKDVASLIQRDEEKKMLMGALAGIGNAESLNMITAYLDEPNVRRDAVSTVLAIAKKRAKKQNAAVAKAALEKVVKVAENPVDVKQAQEFLKQIEKEK
ncbi:MAG: hypothetical protein A2283_20870 [Lentisphaerae bacterium RIFOXYA12_FULL_48_11]|nr:MAG: hypothetical protein A2283_20870 [Lentisphaerae bacterium RIFOXYA12_FULL_48_11]